MIISHPHKYLFIELPRTGSTAVSKELVLNYGGEPILKKHATYRDFCLQASEEEKQYFTFSAIRNPMDKALSLYFKYKTDQRDYENPETFDRSNVFVTWLMKSQFRFVRYGNASFTEFFKRYYYLPYDDWSSLSHKDLDFVIRFEHLQEDFANVLELIGLESVGGLPVVNKTAQRSSDFWSDFGPELHVRAQWVFGPYFKRWGYEFPKDWPIGKSWTADVAFKATNFFRQFYWRFLR
jgi:hypothetical protein